MDFTKLFIIILNISNILLHWMVKTSFSLITEKIGHHSICFTKNVFVSTMLKNQAIFSETHDILYVAPSGLLGKLFVFAQKINMGNE